MVTASPPASSTRRFPGRLYLWLGIGLMLLGPVLCIVQFWWAKLLSVPWYLPVLATIGAALALLAVLRTLTVWRIAAVVLCALLTAGEWYLLLSLTKLPVYAGPVSTGASFPTFTTTLADGSVFDQDSLRGEQNTALVFFRGRW